ncbi:unnamed protein product [Caretta caretta]
MSIVGKFVGSGGYRECSRRVKVMMARYGPIDLSSPQAESMIPLPSPLSLTTSSSQVCREKWLFSCPDKRSHFACDLNRGSLLSSSERGQESCSPIGLAFAWVLSRFLCFNSRIINLQLLFQAHTSIAFCLRVLKWRPFETYSCNLYVYS